MKTTHRQASQHKRRWQALEGNPVARAYSKAAQSSQQAKARAEFTDQLLTTRIGMLSAQDGEDATELLAKLAVVIGTPCEAGARQHGHAYPWVRQLHGALRTVQSMCLGGYLWQSEYALALDRALEIAGEERDNLDATHFADAWLEACGLATDIFNHRVTADAIAA